MKAAKYGYFLSILSALTLSLAWWNPGTARSAALGWLSTLLLVYAIGHSATPYRLAYLAGIIANILGFYWLAATISDFGGFSTLAGVLIFSLFVTISALQYIVFVFLWRKLPTFLDRCALRFASAWVLGEFWSIRIFPWQYAHTQLGFLPLAQVADIAGTLLISFIMFWVAEALILMTSGKYKSRFVWSAIIALLASVVYGIFTTRYFRNIEAPSYKVALVQANIETEEKHNIKLFRQNTEAYIRITKNLYAEKRLIIWPETVIQDWIYTGIGNAANDPHLPQLEGGSSLLTGALTFDPPKQLHNSALAILSDNTVPPPYHKRILMPFGEYTPFGDIFPWLKELNATSGNFEAGQEALVFEYNIELANQKRHNMKVAALICYEDVVPALSRESTKKGAELLVNLANDAWFGDSVAPYEHHLIASFRAIENRRFLLRATNSGLTAIVNPIGETVSQLPVFSEGTLLAEVQLLSYKSVYTNFIGEKPWWLLTVAAVFLMFYNRTRIKEK